jgi:uncharacterized phage protein (TIGR01671 family)
MKDKRQLKFRVWDKSNKSFLTNGSSLHNWSQWMLDLETGTLYDAIGTMDGDHTDESRRSLMEDPGYYFQRTKIINESPYVIQQFTNLQDHNGKDIYEGDIIQVSYRMDELGDTERYVSSVVFQDGAFGDEYDYFCNYSFLPSFYMEVLGNIFENPELLKK